MVYKLQKQLFTCSSSSSSNSIGSSKSRLSSSESSTSFGQRTVYLHIINMTSGVKMAVIFVGLTALM